MFKYSAIILLLVSQLSTAQQWLDPTKPLNVSPSQVLSSQTNPLSLQSIWLAKGKKTATISGQSLQEGDVVGDYTLVSIKRNTVLLSNGAEQIELSLFKQAIIKQ